eukprot:4968063-Pleurochrysis_carterae.AAC.2
MEYFEKEVGCKLKSFDDMCCLAHYSPGIARGRHFNTSFKCPCCGYLPTEKNCRQDMAEFEKLSDKEQYVKRQEHNEVGTADRK